MRKYGLIGYPLGHSFSKSYFSNKFRDEGIQDCSYENFPLKNISEFPKLINDNHDLQGLNVTIPYKQEIIKFLDEVDDIAMQVGAVNVIKVMRPGNTIKLKGYNTDVFGFEQPLKSLNIPKGVKALILGTGGASKAVAWVLKNKEIPFNYVSRTPVNNNDLSYSQLNKNTIRDAKIIVNTSPVGMAPNIDTAPAIDYSGISSEHILYDLVYNPEETKFLSYGSQKKAITINGLPMLFFQAEKAWEIWNI